MAEGGYDSGSGSESGDPEKLQRIYDARNVRELFRGRLTDDECFKLLRRHEWDRGKTVEFILKAAPGELVQRLNVDDSDIESRADFVKKDAVLRELAARNEITNSTRQYGCLDCDQMWWRKVPNRKPVSRCFKCKRKFDPIPQEREYGTAEFLCECGNTFTGIGQMGVDSMCYECGLMCFPTKIVPPSRRRRPRRRSNNQHSCSGENCFNRNGQGIPGNICIHPKSPTIEEYRAGQPIGSTGFGAPNTGGRYGDTAVRRRGQEHGQGQGQRQGQGQGQGHGQGQRQGQGQGQRQGHGQGQRQGQGQALPTQLRVRNVRVPSQLHVSTGSTVKTFLNQDNLEPEYQPSMVDIDEVSDEEGRGSGNGGSDAEDGI